MREAALDAVWRGFGARGVAPQKRGVSKNQISPAIYHFRLPQTGFVFRSERTFQVMTLNHNELRTLDLLFQLASSDVPATARRVAERAGRPEAEVLSDLSALARHGLIRGVPKSQVRRRCRVCLRVGRQ